MLKTEYAHKRRYLNPFGGESNAVFYARRKGGAAGMYFTKGKQRAFELLMQQKRDLTAINPVVPEMMKIAALAVSTAPGGNMSFAFSKSVPIAPAKGRGKRTPAWTNRRAKALVPCGFADAKTAKGILQYQNSRKRLSNCPRIPREEVRKYGSFQSGAKYGIYRYEQPPLAKQGIVLKGKGLVVANAFAARRLGLYLRAYPISTGRRSTQSAKR